MEFIYDNSKILRVFGTIDNPLFLASDIASIFTQTVENIAINLVNLDDVIIHNNDIFITLRGAESLKSGLVDEKVKSWFNLHVLTTLREAKHIERIKQLEAEMHVINETCKRLKLLHDNIKFKRSYHRYRKGPSVYFVKDPWRFGNYIKIGNSDDINETLRTYRRFAPETQLLHIIYLNESKLLEQCMKVKYRNNLTHLNHEVVYNICLDELVYNANAIINTLNLEVTVDESVDKYNNIEEDIDLLPVNNPKKRKYSMTQI